MAIAPDSAVNDLKPREYDVAALVRTASWGIGAAGALFLAVLAGLSDPGAPRVATAISALTGTSTKTVTAPEARPASTMVAQPQPQPNPEVRRLNDQVRLLSADRDQLLQRVSVLERNLEDVTGSIRKREAAVTPPVEPAAQASMAPAVAVATAPWPALTPDPPAAAPWIDPPPPAAPPPETTASLPPETPLPPPRPAVGEAEQAKQAGEAPKLAPQQQTAARTETPAGRPSYGIDLGGAVSVDRLRMLWHSLRTNEPRLLQGLRPITHAREARRGGRPDVRLIAGPLSNADEAAKLCAAILNAGRYCEPTMYHGQRLSLR